MQANEDLNLIWHVQEIDKGKIFLFKIINSLFERKILLYERSMFIESMDFQQKVIPTLSNVIVGICKIGIA